MKEINILELINDYTINNFGLNDICQKYKIGKLKVKTILKANNIAIKKKGKQKLQDNFIVKDYKIEKYINHIGYHFEAIDEYTQFKTTDYMNHSGILTSHIKKTYGVEIPSLYNRRLYYMRTGNYWWEQWFKIIKVKNNEVKHCPYCDWSTKDIENKSGAFEIHLMTKHGINKYDYIKEFPHEKYYFQLVNSTLNLQMEDDENKFVICKICGKKLKKITTEHLKKHHITKDEYIKQYGFDNLVSNDYHEKLKQNAIYVNEHMNRDFSSKEEKEICDFISNLGFECYCDRKILKGKELDIFIPSKNLAIEYNGLLWHSEKFNKDKNYHLNKLIECNKKGIYLIQIFEDEYIKNKNIVLNKIRHILQCDNTWCKIPGRKCFIQEITNSEAEEFLNLNHIQGFCHSTVYMGAFYFDKLIGVMTFTHEGSEKWNLTRFATLNGYICQGVGGKMFNWFVKNYNPLEVKSFADRRWTLNGSNNLYTHLGFRLDKVLEPEYRYYNQKIDKYQRIHKFNFRKQILHKKYGFPLSMTESEMAKELGYVKIWDCGLFKYVWKKEKSED